MPRTIADRFTDYFYGSPEQQAAESAERERRWQEVTASPEYQVLEGMRDRSVYIDGRPYDPRELRMGMVQDTLRPGPSGDYYEHLKAAPGKAYSAVFETAMRPRDTLIKAAQAYNADDYGRAAELALRAPISAAYPSAAAGTPGSPDDWREDARRLGISDGNITAIDLLTDPETYLPVPIPFKVAGRLGGAAMRSAGAVGDLMRYGRGAPTHIVDEAGNEIRRLMNSPRSTEPRALGY
jgi:hypothetical protein